jgi:hypothetical protein
MLIGYARVSTHEQSLSLQLDALKKAGCRKVFDDKVSGARSERPGLEAALEYVREGDTLLVWRLDRLGRSLKDLIEIIGGLEKRGIGFRSLQESIDTTTSGGRLIFHIFRALAKFERLKCLFVLGDLSEEEYRMERDSCGPYWPHSRRRRCSTWNEPQSDWSASVRFGMLQDQGSRSRLSALSSTPCSLPVVTLS